MHREDGREPAMLDIKIAVPVHEPRRYAFHLQITYPDGTVKAVEIGIKDSNFDIPHHEMWDSFFPLMYLSRNGGPLYGKSVTCARVRAAYPLHRAVVDFFVSRARRFGLDIRIESATFDRHYDETSTGDLVLFGGGKDSRLLLGTLREIGADPKVICARGDRYASDLPDTLTYAVPNFSMPARIVPGLMLKPRNLYHGSGLGEVHINQPWQQYFDISAQSALDDMSNLLRNLGFDINLQAPQSILPYNLVQKILSLRYPALAAGQVSVMPQEVSEKNLHVALLKIYHGINADSHCERELLDKMLVKFVVDALGEGADDFGLNRHREVIHREMRAIIFRLHRQGRIELPAQLCPLAGWDEPWIDFIHEYCNPAVPDALMAIYREYAQSWPAYRVGLPSCLAAYLPCGSNAA